MIIPMTNKKGQKYHCSVPKHEDKEDKKESESEDEVDANGLAGEQSGQEKVEITGLAKARKLLEPMSSQPCLLRTKDWWTYEFCYGRTVKQFHMEGKHAS